MGSQGKPWSVYTGLGRAWEEEAHQRGLVCPEVGRLGHRLREGAGTGESMGPRATVAS